VSSALDFSTKSPTASRCPLPLCFPPEDGAPASAKKPYPAFTVSAEQLEEEAKEALARLILSAQEDTAFREQVLSILRLPLAERAIVVSQAVETMKARNEPDSICLAFQFLSNPSAAEGIIAAINDF